METNPDLSKCLLLQVRHRAEGRQETLLQGRPSQLRSLAPPEVSGARIKMWMEGKLIKNAFLHYEEIFARFGMPDFSLLSKI